MTKRNSKNITSFYLMVILFFFAFHVFAGEGCFVTPILLDDSVSLTKSSQDTISLPKKKSKGIKDKVIYTAKDSVCFDLDSSKVYLYNEANVQQKKINLNAGFIEIDFDSSTLWATPVKDTADTLTQYPIFKDGADEYKSKELSYNFDTEKGLIHNMFTKEHEGYLHGEKIKKMNDTTLYVSKGMFTTCDKEDEPHFGINFSKAEIITQDKIITGPAWFSIMGIPLPVGLPFGFFPFTNEQKSGLLMPTYGFASNRGYYLRNLGWYFAFNDYVDLALQGDIYTNLSYAVNVQSSYVKRYKYTGKVLFRFEENHTGLKNTDTWSSQKDFKINWTHTQNAKAHPYRTFSANVNIVSSKYNKYTTSLSDYLTNTTTSSIAFSTRFGSNWNLSANLGESYNINSKYISLDLPSIALSSTQFHPFKKKTRTGKPRWYEDITIAYRLNAINSIQTYDSLLFKDDWYKKMSNGIKHYIPIQLTTKVLKYFNWTNSIDYNARWYLQSTHKAYNSETNRIDKDTVFGFTTNRDASFSSSLNTRIYGMFNFKSKYVKALRHVLNPVLSFTFRPDFSSPSLGFYDYYIDANGEKVYYSRTENGVYGSVPMGRSGIVNFALNNSLEMKVRDENDSITGTRKLVLLENFALSTGYDLAKDTCQWQPLRISARTTLFEKLVVNYSSSFTPYALDSNSRITRELLWDKEGKMFQKQSAQWNLTLSWRLNSKANNQATPYENVSPTELAYSPFVNNNEFLPDIVDFSIPWDVTISGTFSHLSTYLVALAGYRTSKSATLSFTGNVNVTDKWKIGYRTGYDFINKDFTYTSIDFYRDLHCWEMRMNWVPFGVRQGWNFTIAVKAGMLSDLKYEKRNDFRNRMTY